MRKKLKKIFNNKIFMFIFGGVLLSAVSVYAVTYFPSNQVTYDNSSSKLNSTNVQGAIDELYNTCKAATSVSSGDYMYYLVYNPLGGSMIYTETAWLKKFDLNTNKETTLKSYTVGDAVGNIVMDGIYVTDKYLYYSYHDNGRNSTTADEMSWLKRIDLSTNKETTLKSYTVGDDALIISDIFIK